MAQIFYVTQKTQEPQTPEIDVTFRSQECQSLLWLRDEVASCLHALAKPEGQSKLGHS